jgi:hypothetical protein
MEDLGYKLTVLAEEIHSEGPILPILIVVHPLFFTVLGVFYIFLFWVLWKIVQCLKMIVLSLHEIAVSLKSKS